MRYNTVIFFFFRGAGCVGVCSRLAWFFFGGGAGGAGDGEGQHFLNLPLNEAGSSFLQCMLAMEGVAGRKGGEGTGGQQPRQLSRCVGDMI